MDRENRGNDGEGRTHILVISYPLQGHINPLLQFSKRLVSKGLMVTLIIPSSTIRFAPGAVTDSVIIAYIPDGSKESGNLGPDEELERFRIVVTRSLAEFIREQLASEFPPKALVYDSVMLLAPEIAVNHGLHAVPFFTQACVVNAIYLLTHRGRLETPDCSPFSLIASLPPLEVNDLPSWVTDTEAYPGWKSLVVNQFSVSETAKWILLNTFFELEKEVVEWMEAQLQRPILTVGPTVPSVYLDQRMEHDKDYDLSLFKPDMEATMTWLDAKDPNSVAYVSFGSLANLGEAQMEELAWGLRDSNVHFLWVVRETEKKKLPPGFCDEVAQSGKGLLVSWCSQLQVLAHETVGCFVTHCGWNSTLEALSLGLPLVAMAQWTDQPTNAKFIEDVWKVGLRVAVNGEKRIAGRKQIEESVREVMVGEKGKEIRENSLRWRELAKRAVGEGGSSDRNIDKFVSELG